MKLKFILLMFFFSMPAVSADYKVDTKGMHASILFKISHLGTSWMWGRFDKFSGDYSFDPKKPSESKISFTVETNSINTNHAERDKHLRGKGFLYVKKYPQATFVSDSFTLNEDRTGQVAGKLTLRGVTKRITIDIKKTGEGRDPWGRYRTGFEGSVIITLADFGMVKQLGKSSKTLELIIAIEGKKQ